MKKQLKCIASIAFFFLTTIVFSQEYLQMMDAGTFSVEEVQQSAEAHFEGKPKGRGSGYKQYKRWEYMAQRMMDENGYLKPTAFYIRELERYNAKQNEKILDKSLSTSSWEDMGPTYWSATSSWNPGVGRITAIAIDPANEDHILVGGETGGVWKTTDGGENWEPLTDYFSSLLVYALEIDPNNSDTYYFGSQQGSVYKSTDAGATWNALANAGWSVINKILAHPQNADILFATSEYSGIYRSDDGGISWTNVTNDSRGYDVAFQPNDPDTVYASGLSFHKSVDGGVTFSEVSGFDSGPKMMDVSLDDPDVVYVVEAFQSRFGGLYKSTDAGDSFTELSHAGNNYFGYSTTGDDFSGQAPRDMDVAVNPNNVDEVHIAGILTWRSLDGGETFTCTSDWIPQSALGANIGYNHADVDIMLFYDNILYTGTDGGIFKAENTTDLNSDYYTDITEGLGIRQFYKIGLSQTDPVIVSGGSQDNGTSVYSDQEGWKDWLGADGMETFVDKDDTDILYGTSQFGNLYRSDDGGNSYSNLTLPGSGQGNWVTPFEQDPIEENTIYVAYDRIFKSTNSGGAWIGISDPFSDYVDHFKIAPSDNQTMYAAVNSSLYKTTTGGDTWEELSGFLGNVNDIAIHPNDAEKVAITTTHTSDKIYITSDGGENWESYRKNLPNFQALAVVWDSSSVDGLYVGMNYGIYYINNIMDDWIPFQNNLPNVIINELEINNEDGNIYTASYGRGLWRSPLYDETLGTETVEAFQNLKTYPNPTSDVVQISWNESIPSEVRLFNTSGKLLYLEKEVDLQQGHVLQLASFVNGVYYLRVNNAKGVTTKKIIRK